MLARTDSSNGSQGIKIQELAIFPGIFLPVESTGLSPRDMDIVKNEGTNENVAIFCVNKLGGTRRIPLHRMKGKKKKKIRKTRSLAKLLKNTQSVLWGGRLQVAGGTVQQKGMGAKCIILGRINETPRIHEYLYKKYYCRYLALFLVPPGPPPCRDPLSWVGGCHWMGWTLPPPPLGGGGFEKNPVPPFCGCLRGCGALAHRCHGHGHQRTQNWCVPPRFAFSIF